MRDLMSRIREGMDVYDNRGERIGTVDYVQFGDEDPTQPGVETVTGSADPYYNAWAEAIADVFDPAELPEPVRARMRRYGFIRIDAAGLFQADRFAVADQIASVGNDRVTLKLSADEVARPM